VIVIPDDGSAARRTPGVHDGDLPARLLTFLEQDAAPAGPSSPVPVDAGLVERLRSLPTGSPSARTGGRPALRRGRATSR
jgi:hypothetical protein